MAFWIDASDTTNDPKRAFRWILTNGNFDRWVVKKVDKPNFTVAESVHKYLNHTFYFPGRVEWQEIDATLVDPVNPDTSAAIANIMQSAGYVIPTNADGLRTMSKASAATALGMVTIEQIDSKGVTIEKWTLNNAFIKDVNFGTLDYDSDDLVEITVKFRYDWATFHPTNGAAKADPNVRYWAV